MATTTTRSTEQSDTAGTGVGVQLRYLPLSRIVVPEGFNPRGEVADDRELEQMAESIRQDGCLQPIRVRATEHGDYVLIAGERRYRAAVKAAVIELPAIIRPVGVGDDDEHADLLVEALIENDLSPRLGPPGPRPRLPASDRLRPDCEGRRRAAERPRRPESVSTSGS